MIMTFAAGEAVADDPPAGVGRGLQAPVRVNVTCVTPLGEEMASTS
jgi:hypothetical protein